MAFIFVHAPPASPIEDWLLAAGFTLTHDKSVAMAVVFTPDLASDVAGEPPRVACLPVDRATVADCMRAPHAADFAGVRADAYASEEPALLAALHYVLREPRGERMSGPLRLTWLGSLGELQPAASPPIGAVVPLSGPLVIGRSSDAHLCLRHGAHSDQNTVARRHLIVEPYPRGAHIRDCQSTNGTWVSGQRVTAAELRPGEEIAVAGTHRIRLDGSP